MRPPTREVAQVPHNLLVNLKISLLPGAPAGFLVLLTAKQRMLFAQPPPLDVLQA